MKREELVLAPLQPIRSPGDYLPVLAIEDGRMADWLEQTSDDRQELALEVLMKRLYPNKGWCN
jgi:hypothetical protein